MTLGLSLITDYKSDDFKKAVVKQPFICVDRTKLLIALMLVLSKHSGQQQVEVYDCQASLMHKLRFLAAMTYPQMVSQLQSDKEGQMDICFSTDLTSAPASFKLLLVYEKETLTLYYNACQFRQAHMISFLGHTIQVYKEISETPDKAMNDILGLSNDERDKILNEWTQTACPLDHTPVLSRFYAQVKKRPDAVAVKMFHQQITYAAFSSKINQLARHLQELGVGRQRFVLIYANRSIEMITAIFAVLAAGGAYCPLNPDCPPERLKYIVKELKPVCILQAQAVFPLETTLPIINAGDTFSQYESYPLSIDTQENDLCYCIYTSGSTGQPKGVLIKHIGLINLLEAYTQIYALTEQDVVLQAASFTFDQSVWDIFNILTIGGTLCLIDKETLLTPEYLETICLENQVSVVSLTPMLINELQPDHFPTLRILDSSGEAAKIETLSQWLPYTRVFNTYGPTEITVNASSYEYHGEAFRTIPIGKPIINTQFYVLDENLQPCGLFMPGELYIGGLGLAAGYLNDPLKTAQAFIDHPLGRLYKTGDKVRWLEDGNLDYIGRNDDQIKIRGYRIEIGDIEMQLRNYPQVIDAGVVIEESADDHQIIHAFLTVSQPIEKADIALYLSQRLPYYMLPASITVVPQMPLLPSGKLDRKGLLSLIPEKTPPLSAKAAHPWMKTCMEIYREVLHLPFIDIKDSFIEMGGNSINAIRIAGKLRQFGWQINPCEILQAKNISGLEPFLKNTIHKMMQKEDHRYPLTDNQKILMEEIIQNPRNQVMQMVYRCPSCQTDLLLHGIHQLIHTYDIFRIRIIDDDQEISQFFSDEPMAEVISIKAPQHSLKTYMAQDIARGIHVFSDALIRFTVIQFPDTVYLILTMSHLIIDGWSVDILFNQLANYYAHPHLPIQEVPCFEDYLALKDHPDDTDYWLAKMENACQITLPHIRNIPVQTYAKYETFVTFGDSVSQYCQKHLVTENTIFETAYILLLHQLTQNPDVCFQKVVSGRDVPLTEADSVVGMLMRFVPQRIYVNTDPQELCRQVYEINLRETAKSRTDLTKLHLLENLPTIFVFSHSLLEDDCPFIYETEVDQDEVDVTFYVEYIQHRYHIYTIYRESFYSEDDMKKIVCQYLEIVHDLLL